MYCYLLPCGWWGWGIIHFILLDQSKSGNSQSTTGNLRVRFLSLSTSSYTPALAPIIQADGFSLHCYADVKQLCF